MKQIYVIAMLVAALSLLVACDGDEPGNNVKPTLYNLVTFDGNGEEGAMFTLLRQSGQPAVSYVARGSRLDEKKYKPGTRVLIGYKTPSGSMDESGYITLTEYGMVNNDYLRMAPMPNIPNA